MSSYSGTIWCLIGACALAGCQTMPVPEPQIVVHTITNTVQVPVAVACFTEDERPKIPTPTPIDLDHATTDQVAAAQAADLKNLDDYARLVDALFQKCTTGGTP